LASGTGDLRGDFLRLALDLADWTIEPGQVEEAAKRLNKMRKRIDEAWQQQVAQLRKFRPMRFRITHVQFAGNIPPQEMFDRAMTLVSGVLESGMVKLGDTVLIPRENEELLAARVTCLFDWDRDCRELIALRPPLHGAMMWWGHQHGIRIGSAIVHADSPATRSAALID
jgi:hypothetical protein